MTHAANRWRAAVDVYLHRRVAVVLCLGFASGLPLSLSASTLYYWLSKVGVDKSEIGLFALVGLSYNLKFLWSPLFDHVAVPWLTAARGRRRSWAAVTQLGLIGAMLITGSTDPGAAPLYTALGAVLIAFFSASQDIVIDAYRVELLAPEQQAAGAAVNIYGYRFGMLISSAGSLYLSDITSWFNVFAVMAAVAGLCMVAVLTLFPEPELVKARTPPQGPMARLKHAIIDPFADFATRPRWAQILLFVVLYKLCDAVAGVMSNPFYNEIGFTATEIANIVKLFGLIATLVGVFVGGALASSLGMGRVLFLGGLLQMASNLMFAVQAEVGANINLLALTIFFENFSGGVGTAAFVAYLASLCSREFTATHYALLSSLASVGRTLLSTTGGVMAEALSWTHFFILTSLLAIPSLVLLTWLLRFETKSAPIDPEQTAPQAEKIS